jgi:flagellar hook-length control protein FliK
MRIKLAVERGVMVAQFLVENSRVQELISAQLPQLYAALQDQGTVLGDVMIDIGLGQDKLGRENQSQGRAPGRSGQAKAGAKETATAARYLAGSSWHRVDVRV